MEISKKQYRNVVFHVNKCIDGLYRRCNNNCIFCSENVDEGKSCGIFISIDMMARVLDFLRERYGKVDNIFFAGGEPTLRNEFPVMIRMAKNISDNVHMTSNGTFENPEGMARLLKQSGLTNASFSLHGQDAVTHEKSTRTPGSFLKLTRSLKCFLENDFHVSINCVVTKLNVENLPKIVQLVAKKFQNIESLTFTIYRKNGEACDYDSELSFSPFDFKYSLSKSIDLALKHGVNLYFRDCPFCVDSRIKEMNLDVKDIYVVLWEDVNNFFFCSESLPKTRPHFCDMCSELDCIGFSDNMTARKADKYQAWEIGGQKDV